MPPGSGACPPNVRALWRQTEEGKREKAKGLSQELKGEPGWQRLWAPRPSESLSTHTHVHTLSHTCTRTRCVHPHVHEDTHPCARLHRVSTYTRTRPHALTLTHIPVGTHSATPPRTASSGCDTHADRGASVGRRWPGCGPGDDGAEVKGLRYLGEKGAGAGRTRGRGGRREGRETGAAQTLQMGCHTQGEGQTRGTPSLGRFTAGHRPLGAER